MQTNFSAEQLKEKSVAKVDKILRACVHCGMCTATCPTYQILGDELDSPRGRIYLIKDMLENERIPDATTVKHIDRCLSCLACMTTCPSGVDYMHLIDHAREYVEKKYKRRWDDRLMRWLLAKILPYPNRFRLSIYGAKLAKPFAPLIPKKFRTMVEFAPNKIPPKSPNDRSQVFKAKGKRIKRIALMTGCAQKVLNTDINDATISILTRHGCDVIIAKDAGCCGALTHHMGKVSESHKTAAKNIIAWNKEIENEGLDAIVINTSGCGTTVKDYGVMFEGDILEVKAKKIAQLAKDISEVMMDLDIKPSKNTKKIKVAYHAACSLQHGQQIKTHPKTLLKRAGYKVVEPVDAHLCCGSAGTYNLMQPEISTQLKSNKVNHIENTKPDIIATGNIGCMMQIGSGTKLPIVHTIELLDYATGGKTPPALEDIL
jgi:glycolate oxidase iron-sulfur subunit